MVAWDGAISTLPYELGGLFFCRDSPLHLGCEWQGSHGEGKGLALSGEIRNKKTTTKAAENCKEWGEGLCPALCSALPGAALQKRGRVCDSKEEEHKHEADGFISQYHIFGCWQVLTWIIVIRVHCLFELFCLPQMSLKCTCSTRLVT